MDLQLTVSFASPTESKVPWLHSFILEEFICENNLWGFEHAHMKKYSLEHVILKDIFVHTSGHGVLHYQSFLSILKTFITSSSYFLIILRRNSPGILFIHSLVGALLAVAVFAS